MQTAEVSKKTVTVNEHERLGHRLEELFPID